MTNNSRFRTGAQSPCTAAWPRTNTWPWFPWQPVAWPRLAENRGPSGVFLPLKPVPFWRGSWRCHRKTTGKWWFYGIWWDIPCYHQTWLAKKWTTYHWFSDLKPPLKVDFPVPCLTTGGYSPITHFKGHVPSTSFHLTDCRNCEHDQLSLCNRAKSMLANCLETGQYQETCTFYTRKSKCYPLANKDGNRVSRK